MLRFPSDRIPIPPTSIMVGDFVAVTFTYSQARVDAILFDRAGFQYKVCYFNDQNQQREAWAHADEVQLIGRIA